MESSHLPPCWVTGWPLIDLRTTGLVVLDELYPMVTLDPATSDATTSYSTRTVMPILPGLFGSLRCQYLTIQWDANMPRDLRRWNSTWGIQWCRSQLILMMPCGVIACASSWFLVRVGTKPGSPVPFWDASQEEVTSAFRSEKGSFYLVGRGINTEQITLCPLLFAFLQPGYIPPRLDKVLSHFPSDFPI